MVLLRIAVALICLNSLGQIKDDTKHYYAGALISGVTSEIAYEITSKAGLSCWIGIGTGTAITWGKEFIYDRYLGRGFYNNNDGFIGTMGSIHAGLFMRVKFDIHEKRRRNRHKEN